MHFVAKRVLAIILMAIPPASYSAGAQTPNPTNSDRWVEPVTPSNGTTPLTMKERLGEKWNDEQRVDNCKVPLEKRGTRPRPECCVHLPKD
jgi:hypothetical protein